MPVPLKISLSVEEDRTLRELSYADGVPERVKQWVSALRLSAAGWKVDRIGCHLDQCNIKLSEGKFLLKVLPIRLLSVVTVATQVGKVDLATYHQNGCEQRHEKRHLQFAKMTTFASRLCTISSIAIRLVLFQLIRTLKDA